MAYTLYLYKEFPSKSNKTIRLEIFQKDYVGSAIEIEELAGNPIILNTDNSANDIDVPIIKTSLSINIIDTNQFDYSIFFTPDATKFKVIVKVSGTIEWTGFLTPDSFVQSESYRSSISLIARDNIGMLAEFEYDGTQLPVKINTTINNAFTKINFGGVLEYRVKKLDNAGVNILNDIVNGKLFVGRNYYEVVEILLRGIGCQLRYVGGNKYAIFDIADLKGYGDTLTAQTFLFIEQSGAVEIVPARKSIKITQDYGLQESIYDGPIPTEDFSFIEQRNAGLQYLTYRLPRPPVPAEQQDFYVNYYNIPIGARWVSTMALLEPTYFQRPESSILITGTNTESIVGLGKLMYSRAIPETNRDTNLKITVDVSKLIYGVGKYQRIGDELALWDMRIGTSNSKLHFRCNFFFDDGTTIQYLSSGGWREKPLDYADRFDIVLEQVEDESSTDTPYQTLEFNLGNADSAGTLTMEIYPYWLENNTLSLNVSAYVMELRDFDIKFVRLDEKIGGVESVGVINNDYNLASEVNLSIGQVPNYLGNNLTMLAGIFQDASYYPPAFDFHRPSGTNYKLFELIGREIAHHYKTQKNKLSGTIINSLNFVAMPSFGKTFTDGVKNYALNYGALDFRNETMQVELIEVEDYVTEDYTFVEAEVESGSGSMGSGENEYIQWSAAGNAKRIYELDTASEADQAGAFVFIDKSGLSAAKKVPISSLLVDAYTKTESDSRFASIDGDLTQDFSAKKLTTATLLLPQTAPILASGEAAIYSLDSGFSGELPSGAGSVTSIALTMPTGFSVSGSPITESGTFGVTFASGYFLPTTTQFATKADVSLIGAANGIAPLDSGGKVALQYLPSTLLKYMGVWDASTNTPTLLATDTARKGQVWNVSVAGTQFGIAFKLGDWLIYNDSGVAEKSDNSDDVVSVNGYTGAVTLKTSDITEQTNLYYTDARVKAYADTLYTPLAHASATNNPHSVTAAQVGALAISGGELTGTLTLKNQGWINFYNSTNDHYISINYIDASNRLDFYDRTTGTVANIRFGTAEGALSGNATTATTLQNTRTIWGQNFNGSANITGALTFVTDITASGKIASGTLLLPQSIPTLASGEMAIYGLESGFSGEMPSGAGSVESVALVSNLTGISVTGSPITTSGTFTLNFVSGYSIPTNIKQGEWDNAYALRHNAVTLGTANGLSLSTQELSLGLASTSANGALSSTDWNTFNGKQAKLIGTGASSLVRVNTLGTITYDDNTYLTGNQTITLSGIITGSGTTAITTAIADGALSIAKTNGLQTALDAKMATASYPDLVAIEALAGTSGFLKKTAADTWTLDTSTYLTAITKAQVEAVLTGTITSHNHNGTYALISGATTQDFQVKALTMNGALSGATTGSFNGNVSLAGNLNYSGSTDFHIQRDGITNIRINTIGNLVLSSNAQSIFFRPNGSLISTNEMSLNTNGVLSVPSLTLNGSISGATTILASGIVSLTNTTQSTAYTNGALVLLGGLGIAKDLFSNGKGSFNTLIIPQVAPTLTSGEMAIYGLESGFSGELPSGAGSVTSISMVVPTGISVTPATITESGTFTISYASGYQMMTSTESSKLAGIEANANNYTLPTATNLVLGGVKIGSNITITDGVISVAAPYTLPTATASVLGGVKIGTNVTITDGVISVHNPVTLGTANGLSLSTQVLSLGLASTSANGALSSTDWNTFNGKQAKLVGTGASSLVRVNASGTIDYDDNTYLTGNQTITLSGIITGSGTTAITTAIADNALSIAKTNGLQTALDAKMATASYPDLVAIEALSGTSGLLKKTASNTWTLDTNTYLTAITKAQVEAVLTGTITSHNHNGTYALISGATTQDFQVKALTMNGALSGATTGSFNGNVSLAGNLNYSGSTDFHIQRDGITNIRINTIGNLVLSSNAQSIFFRPNGSLISTNEMSLNTNGVLSVPSLTLNGSISGATTISASGIVSLTNTTQSTAYTNGALVLSGGLGIAKDLYSNGKAVFASSVQMSENINTNLRIPKVAPTSPTSGEYYFYIVE